MGTRLFRILFTTGVGLIGLGATGSAIAQAEQEESGALEEVTVTATFREERLQDTPIAITAVTGEMLESRSQTSVYEVAAQAPNVTLSPQGQSNGSGLIAFIRGVGQTDFNYALEPGVGLYIDDVYYPTLTGSLVDLLDLDRVEVLRGPQGTLAGRNSIGGAIKLFSKRPSGSGGSAQVSYGSFDRIEARAMADFALVPDKFYARIAGVSKNRDGYIERRDYGCSHPGSGVPTFTVGIGCDLGTLGGQAYTAGRLSLRWVASESVEVNIVGDLTNDRSEAGADVLRGAFPSTTAVPNSNDTTRINIDDGNPATPVVPYDCRFVPFGPDSCDPNRPNDPYLSYANFLDSRAPVSQMPFKPVQIDPIQQLNQSGVSATIDWQLNDRFSIKSITAWRQYDSSWAQDVDNSPIASQQLLQTLVHDQKSQELRLNGTLMGDKLDFTTGLFWFDQDGTLEARVDLPYAGLDFIHGPDTTPSTSKAAFLQTAYHVNPLMNLSAGVRYSKDEKTYTYFRSNPNGTVPNAPCIGPPTNPINAPNCALLGLFNISDSFEGNRTDWRVALDYRFSDSVMTYGQVSTGFRSGGVNPRPFFAPGTILPVTGNNLDFVNGIPTDVNQLSSFEPETLTSYEIGFKTDLLDRRMRLNVATFYNQYEDIILSSTRCPIAPCIQPNNIGEANVKGFEIETEFRPNDAWLFDAAVSWLDFKYTETNVAQSNVATSMITPFTPEKKASAGIQYTFPLGSLGSLSTRLDGTYQSEIFTDAINAPTNRIDSYTLANARITWRSPDDSWATSFEVTNLTNEYYEFSRFDQRFSSGTVSVQPAPPLMWAISIKRTFE
jgi:iron complex outermembrane recepter protein